VTVEAEVAERKEVNTYEMKREPGEVLEKLMTPGEVSAETGISLDTLAMWRSRKRRLPYLKLGRCVRYRASTIEQWFQSSTVEVDD
jgi:predicted DNA-binding transcriptional regulator AlpA